MDIALAFLRENYERLDLAAFNIPKPLTSVMLTPRFVTSRHVIFMILPAKQSSPVLVAKIPRLPSASDLLNHEVQTLRWIQAWRMAGLDSIPRVIAFEAYRGFPILIETALSGQLLSRDVVRQNPLKYARIISDWILDIQGKPTALPRDDWYEVFVHSSLDFLRHSFPLDDNEVALVNRTEELLAPLQHHPLPYVLEHGDLSHPNLLLLGDGKLGVVDWELASIEGLVASDLFFGLAYVAFSAQSVVSISDYIRAFQDAFLGPRAWTMPYIREYANAQHIDHAILRPLFLLCWTRYFIKLVQRLHFEDPFKVRMSHETLDLIRQNRFYALWRFAVENFDQLASS